MTGYFSQWATGRARYWVAKMAKTIYLCLFLSLFHLTSSKSFRPDYHYIESQRSYYKIHTTERPWEEAKRTCESEGATFFYPESEEESAAVRAYVKDQYNYNNYWIGISSPVAVGIFVTVDGKNLADVYHKWAAGDPNNLNDNEHCVLLEHTGLIYDGRCSYDLKFVCKKTLDPEKEKDSDLPFTDGQHENYFRSDYHYIESEQSFYKIHTIGRPWEEAQKTCELEGATFFYPTSEAESAAVRAYVKREQDFYNFWIGISCLVRPFSFVTVDGRRIPEVYHKWAPGDPNNLGDNERCVLLEHTGLMYDGRCSQNLRFVCKKTLESLKWNTACNLTYPDYKYNSELKKCYKAYHEPLSWTEAYRTCASELSYLAIIDSPGEEEFLQDQLTTKDNSIREEEQMEGQPGQYFVGVHFVPGEGWRTVKGAPLSSTNGYSKWQTNQPDSAGSDKCAAATMSNGGGLNDVSCQATRPFVCEHDVPRHLVIPPYLRYGD